MTNLPTSNGVKRGHKSYTSGTYVNFIARVIQDSPDKMLTFKQIMKRVEPFVFGERKRVENNIRVCLSSNSCFTKVPVNPQYPNPKNNYWKVDVSGITPKMLRRHFSNKIDKFPGLSFKTHQKDKCAGIVVPHEPHLPVSCVPENKTGVKFSGPFSIDSLLKRDHKVMHTYSTCSKERLQYKDARCFAGNSRNLYESAGFYFDDSLESQINPTEKPRPPAGPQFGLFVAPQITYDPCGLHSNFNGSPLMYARYVGW